jgi:phage shock protein C
VNDANTIGSRRFLRDPPNGYLGGVCAGIAARLRLPALLLRIVAVLALLSCTLPTMLAYGLLWLFMDSRDEVCSRLA